MTNEKKIFNKHELIGKIFNRFFWFMVIFGIIEIVLLKRVVGWVILTGGIFCLLTYYAKVNKWGPFKPQQKISKTQLDVQDNQKLSIVRIFIILLMFGFAFSMIYFGWHWHKQVNENMNKDCKGCSIFQKDCPFTDKELLDQEYGNGPCSDMGLYELLFKGTLLLIFMGIIFLGMGIATLYMIFKDSKKFEKQVKTRAEKGRSQTEKVAPKVRRNDRLIK